MLNCVIIRFELIKLCKREWRAVVPPLSEKKGGVYYEWYTNHFVVSIVNNNLHKKNNRPILSHIGRLL